MGSRAKGVGAWAVVMGLVTVIGGTPVAAQIFSQPLRVSGEIAAIDAKQGVVKLRVSEEPAAFAKQPEAEAQKVPTEFLVDAKTHILAAGAQATLKDLEVGNRATVEYALETGNAIALSIHVQEPPAGMKTDAPHAPETAPKP